MNHITAEAGAGFTFPIGRIAPRTHTGFNFVAAGGPRFNRKFSLTLDFSLHYMNLKHFLETGTNVSVSQGSMLRIWSLTANPVYEFIKQEQFSAYATGGYGLYNRKVLLAAPGVIPVAVCDEFWSICVGTPGQTITGDFSVYKGGYNFGGGVTFTPHIRFFVESRYHHMFTSNGATTVIPLTFGIRW